MKIYVIIQMQKKFIKVYNFNDGVDGIVVAKSLKQTVNILSKINATHGYGKKEIIDSCKKSDKSKEWGLVVFDWEYEKTKVPKRKCCNKPKMLGWCE